MKPARGFGEEDSIRVDAPTPYTRDSLERLGKVGRVTTQVRDCSENLSLLVARQAE